MADTEYDTGHSGTASDQPEFRNYLPGGPQPSREPGRVERFLSRLLRRRGRLRRVVRRQYR